MKTMERSAARRGPHSTPLRYLPLDYSGSSASYNNNQTVIFLQLRSSAYILHISFYMMLHSIIILNPF